MRRFALLILTLTAGVLIAACGSDDESAPTAAAAPPTAQPTAGSSGALGPPAGDLDTSKRYIATFKTERGDFKVELFDDNAPKTVENFVNLAQSGYYDGTTFHRVIDGFMAQGGDPTGTGSGGPGYRFADEFHPSLRHDSAGILSMANSGRNTNGSQFFITFSPTPHLNDVHSVFGKVIEGMDIVNSLTIRDPASATSPGDKINTIEIDIS